jgi:hypothetical protein
MGKSWACKFGVATKSRSSQNLTRPTRPFSDLTSEDPAMPKDKDKGEEEAELWLRVHKLKKRSGNWLSEFFVAIAVIYLSFILTHHAFDAVYQQPAVTAEPVAVKFLKADGIYIVTSNTYDQFVGLDPHGVYLVEFYAPW